MPQRGANQVCDRDRWKRRFLTQRDQLPSRLEPKKIRLLEVDLGRLLDDDDPVLIGNVRGQRIQEGRLAGSGSSGNQNIPVHGDGVRELRRELCTESTDRDEILQRVAV